MGKNFSPINVEDKVLIRAEFHEPILQWKKSLFSRKCLSERDIIPTTHLMIQQMLEMDFKDKKFWIWVAELPFCIYAKMKGAKDVLAIDIDEWSVENSKENAEKQRRTQNRTGNCRKFRQRKI